MANVITISKEDIRKLFDKKNTTTGIHDKILGKLLNLLRASWDMKNNRLDQWQKIENYLYPQITAEDEAKGRVRLSLIYLIIDSFKNKIVNLFLSKNPPIQLEPLAPEDVIPSYANEIVLNYQLQRNKFSSALSNIIFNLLAYGIGIGSVEWVDDIRKMNYWREDNIDITSADGQSVNISQIIKQSTEHTYYRGNIISPIHPTKYIIDPYTPVLRREDLVIGCVLYRYYHM